jgi:WD40 repeat protein
MVAPGSRRHGGAVHGVAFTPDGRQLASGSDDETAVVWDVIPLRAEAR